MPVVDMFLKNACTGKTVQVSVDSSTTVGAIKSKIEEQESIPAATQRLIFAGKVRASLSTIYLHRCIRSQTGRRTGARAQELEDHRILDEYNVAQESTFYLVLRENPNPPAEAAPEPPPAPAAGGAAVVPIQIKLPSGQFYAVDGVTSADTIERVKDRIFQQQGIDQAHQMLILPDEGREAENDRSCEGIEVLLLVLVHDRAGAAGGGARGGDGGGEAVIPARFQPALNIYPGPFQDEWEKVYQLAKMDNDFEKCLTLIADKPGCVNNRNGGPTAWTLLHQAAYWCAPREVLEALHQAGASPELEGQTFEQMQQNAGCVTPLLVTSDFEADDEIDESSGITKREAWRKMYRDVFGLSQPGDRAGMCGRGCQCRACVALGPPPAAAAPLPGGVAAGFQHLVNMCDGRGLTLMPSKDGKLQWGAAPQLAQLLDGTAGQKWRLEAGHLCCEDGGHMLDIDGADVKQGAKVVVWEKRDRPNQTWDHTAEGYLVSALNGLCLHATEDGTVVMWPKEDGLCQKWRFV